MQLLILFVFSWYAHAGTIQECYESTKQNIKQCNDELEKTSEESSSRNGRLGEESQGVRIQGGGNVMSGAHLAEANAWTKLASSCKKLAKDCRRKCQVEPEKQTFADRYIEQCEQKIGKVVQAAEGSADANTKMAAASTASSSTADSADAAQRREVASSRGSQYQDQCVNCPSDIAGVNGEARVEQVGSGSQPLSFVDQNGNRQVYYSSTTGDNLKVNMQYLKGVGGVEPAIMMPGPRPVQPVLGVGY